MLSYRKREPPRVRERRWLFFRIERVLHVVIDISVGLLVGNLLITFASGTYQLIAGAARVRSRKYMFLSSVGNGISYAVKGQIQAEGLDCG